MNSGLILFKLRCEKGGTVTVCGPSALPWFPLWMYPPSGHTHTHTHWFTRPDEETIPVLVSTEYASRAAFMKNVSEQLVPDSAQHYGACPSRVAFHSLILTLTHKCIKMYLTSCPRRGKSKISTVTFLSWYAQKAKNTQTFDPLLGRWFGVAFQSGVCRRFACLFLRVLPPPHVHTTCSPQGVQLLYTGIFLHDLKEEQQLEDQSSSSQDVFLSFSFILRLFGSAHCQPVGLILPKTSSTRSEMDQMCVFFIPDVAIYLIEHSVASTDSIFENQLMM